MKYASLAFICVLSACSTPTCEPVCMPIKQWSDVEQNNLLADFRQLPPDSELIPVVIDYERMRMMARACKGEVNGS